MSGKSDGPYRHIDTVSVNEFAVETTDRYSFDDMQYCHLRFRYVQVDDLGRPVAVSPFVHGTVTFLGIIPAKEFQKINPCFDSMKVALANGFDMLGYSMEANTNYYAIYYVQKAQEYFEETALDLSELIWLCDGYEGTEELIDIMTEMKDISQYIADYYVSPYNYNDFISGAIQSTEKLYNDFFRTLEILNGIVEQWDSLVIE